MAQLFVVVVVVVVYFVVDLVRKLLDTPSYVQKRKEMCVIVLILSKFVGIALNRQLLT
jgi:hypothetical protein